MVGIDRFELVGSDDSFGRLLGLLFAVSKDKDGCGSVFGSVDFDLIEPGRAG